MRRQRKVLLLVGALLGLAPALAVSLLLAGPPARGARAGCTRYPLFRTVWICSGSVYLVHNGRRQFMGRARDLAPMPKVPNH